MEDVTSERAILHRGADSVNNKAILANDHVPDRALLLMAGLFYLGLIVLGIFAQLSRSDLIVTDDAVATVDRIVSSYGMLTVSFVADILSEVCFVLLGLTCFVIFRRTDGRIATVMLLLVIVSGAFAFVNLIHIYDAIQLVSIAPLSVADMDRVLLDLNMYNDGTYYAQVLGWGPWLVPLGYLGYRSRLFPKVVSALLVVGGVGLTVQGIQYLLLPGMGDLFATVAIVSILAEFSTCGWLLYRGMKGASNKDEVKKDAGRTNTMS